MAHSEILRPHTVGHTCAVGSSILLKPGFDRSLNISIWDFVRHTGLENYVALVLSHPDSSPFVRTLSQIPNALLVDRSCL
jgi:hypothetical protein